MQTGLEEIAFDHSLEVAIKLDCLAKRGTIKVVGEDVMFTNKAQPKTSYYELKHPTSHKKIRFACDLYDLENEFSLVAMEKCDYVFKRNYRTSIVKKLESKYSNKLVPLGLTFRVKSKRHKRGVLLFIGLFCQNLKLVWKYDRLFFIRLSNELSKQWKHWQLDYSNRLLERFVEYKSVINNKILFQTRTFDENQEDVLAIHNQRYHLIKLLQTTFPDYFNGGFIPRGVALTKYKDALSNVPSEPEAYLNVVKACSIVIYTRGLAHSPAWKMAEYLSQGKVIMAEPLTTDLPEPLVHGVHLMYFNSDAELIENIKKVQQDTQLAARLSKNARSYFEQWVHPTKNMERILTFMMQKEGWIP